jgi:uncharacterized membrane protein
MTRAPCIAFAVLLVAAAALLFATTGALPDRVPTNFGAGGAPNAWMTRSGYTAYMLAFTVGLPLLVTAAIGVLPRLVPRLVNLPHREHWLAPERRTASLAFLARHACLLGCLMVLLAAGVHWLILRATRAAPPRLEEGLFLWMLGAFLAALAVWMVALYRRFPRPK